MHLDRIEDNEDVEENYDIQKSGIENAELHTRRSRSSTSHLEFVRQMELLNVHHFR